MGTHRPDDAAPTPGTAASPSAPAAARLRPAAGSRELGVLDAALAAIAGRLAGVAPTNLFMTLARHPRLFRSWLRFSGSLLRSGALPRADTELLILRTARNCGCAYEWQHHQLAARRAGLDDAAIARVADGSGVGWTERQAVLLAAADEIHEHGRIQDATWAALRGRLDDRELIELCMLVGHYEMLASVILSLGIEPDENLGGAPRGASLRPAGNARAGGASCTASRSAP